MLRVPSVSLLSGPSELSERIGRLDELLAERSCLYCPETFIDHIRHRLTSLGKVSYFNENLGHSSLVTRCAVLHGSKEWIIPQRICDELLRRLRAPGKRLTAQHIVKSSESQTEVCHSRKFLQLNMRLGCPDLDEEIKEPTKHNW